MEWFYAVNNDFSNWLWGYKTLLVTTWVAVLLVLYGDNINKLLKRIMQPYHYLVRMSAFVVLCSFGYGVLANYGEVAVNHLVKMPDRSWFGGIVLLIYLVLGALAERKHHA
ncbi:DUF3392 family protein [Alteromonas sp. a30]|uniref:DUF3392 family protein n=1 Tax=Alteromonas sp. a30 TaxID=2730917 RepID=UPI002281F73A|nr:DUF3392 family protein [Alteromonas sp. a30]MCY7296808.1 DUF3392 family protein [Alteromonas sp. a30]